MFFFCLSVALLQSLHGAHGPPSVTMWDPQFLYVFQSVFGAYMLIVNLCGVLSPVKL